MRKLFHFKLYCFLVDTFCLRPEVPGHGLNGSCKVHGRSKENVQDKGDSLDKVSILDYEKI